jgi:hypothetical protein
MRGTIESRPDISYQNDQSTAAEQRTEESGEQGLDATSIAAHQAETEEQSALDQSTSDEVASETTTEVTANTDAGRSLTFQRWDEECSDWASELEPLWGRRGFSKNRTGTAKTARWRR